MDPSSTPWRAFEAPETSAGSVRLATSGGAVSPAAQVPRGLVIAIVVATLLLVAGAVWFAGSGSAAATVLVDASGSAPSESAGASDIIVDVAGAVVRPGVYRLPVGSRVADAIAIAGGYGPRIDARRVAADLNLAAPLTDGQHVMVPSRDDVALGNNSNGPPNGGPTNGGLIDLNRATTAELDTLPGVGPVTAAKIVASRESARFTTVQDLKDRKLVGQKTFDGLRDLVTVH